jgi:multidrug efflux system membrane fusion protein
MKQKTLVIGVAALLALAGVVVATRSLWSPEGAVAQSSVQRTQPSVPVDVALAVKKKVPVLIESLGTVTPMASVAVKTRVDSEISAVHFQDGAMVRQGDLLFTLDTRAIDAQIRQAEGALARDRAQLEGAERDVRRYSELAAKGATPITNLDNAKTQVGAFQGAAKANEALLESLKVQLSYATIRAPIAGRASMATVKAGNFVRQADAIPLATIIQVDPVYVSFTVPQRYLPSVRQALAAESATVDVTIPGEAKSAEGQVTMIENTVDAATGMVIIRATMPNKEQLLWPGTLVTTKLTLRTEDAVTIPSNAVQVSQEGSFVFVVKDNVATKRPVTVARIYGPESVIESGLQNGETVVTEGQLRLSNGSRVSTREPKAGT